MTTEYVVSGESALFFASLDAGRSEETNLEQQHFEEECNAMDAVEGILKSHFDRVEDLANAALFAAGFHRPKRQWRRRRERSQVR